MREACKSFLDSIIIELCLPGPTYPKPILYQILHQSIEESPKEAKRFPQALWDAVGDLSVSLSQCAICRAFEKNVRTRSLLNSSRFSTGHCWDQKARPGNSSRAICLSSTKNGLMLSYILRRLQTCLGTSRISYFRWTKQRRPQSWKTCGNTLTWYVLCHPDRVVTIQPDFEHHIRIIKLLQA